MDSPQVDLQSEIAELTASEIVERFEELDFTDPLGHKLTMCRGFLELVEMATGEALPD